MSKIYICGQVSSHGQEENIEELVKTFHYFDGAVWTINYNGEYLPGKTEDLLNLNKGNGKILKCNWVNLHYIGMTMFLQSGVMENGDWICVVDSQEILKEIWLKEMRDNVERYKKDGVTAVFWGRPYFFQYNDQMLYHGSTHCWPSPMTAGKHISIQDESKVRYDSGGVHFGDFLYNKKKFDDSMLLHSFKYIWTYNVTNEMENQYAEFGKEVADGHELMRRQFRDFCKNQLGIPLTLQGIEDYFKTKNWNPNFIEYIELENGFKEYFRFKILNQTREEILFNRYKWSIKEYLKTGDKVQSNSNFVDIRSKYREMKKKKKGFSIV